MEDAEIEQIKTMAREEARAVLLDHLKLCPFAVTNVEPRLRTLENRFSLLVGTMIGSGLLGGVSGALLSKLLG
jgi:hypothetical protein